MYAVPVAEIVRNGFVEGHHYGSVVCLAIDGSVEWSLGDVQRQVLPRSCNKPLQAVGMLRQCKHHVRFAESSFPQA